jgi:hypothetical protein
MWSSTPRTDDVLGLTSLAGAALPDVRHGEKKQDLRAVASNGKGFSVDQ